jgi:hypothetical protein
MKREGKHVMNVVLIEEEGTWGDNVICLTDEKSAISFFQSLYPDKKSLRLKKWSGYGHDLVYRYTLLNHNTPVGRNWIIKQVPLFT